MMLTLTVALADTQVQDDAGLFTADEIAEISAICDRIESAYQVDMFVLTSQDVPSGQTTAYADDYFDYNGLGMGDDRAGMLYLIDMHNRQCWISTRGVMIDYITDEREEGILDAGWDEMLDKEYGQSVIKVLKQTEKYLKQGRTSGQFRYDEVTGRRLTELYEPENMLTSMEILIAAIAGLAVMGIFIASVSGKYSLKGSTYSYDLNGLASVKLSRNDSHFVREHVTRVKHPDPRRPAMAAAVMAAARTFRPAAQPTAAEDAASDAHRSKTAMQQGSAQYLRRQRLSPRSGAGG